MAYPALPTLPASASISFDDLLLVKKGQRFALRGYEHEATSDAVAWERHGFQNVHVAAKRRHAAMPSGWELADVLEHRADGNTAH